MVKEWKKGSWLWGLAAGAGLAVVMVAVMLSSSGSAVYATPEETQAAQTATAVALTPTPTATTNANCDLHVTKDYDNSTVPEGGQISYTISIDNNGDGDGYCTDLTVKDVIPNDTDCVDATVDSSSDIDDSDIDISHCDASGTVKWTTDTNLDTGDTVVLDLTLELTSGANDGDKITNEACATSSNDVGGDCDSAKVEVTSATATPTTAPTATAGPTVAVTIPTAHPATAPVIVAAPTISGPRTGTGTSDSTGPQPLALGLGLLGGLLVVGSGVALVKRTR